MCLRWTFCIGSKQITCEREKHNPGCQEAEVGWYLSKRLEADCLNLGGNWQPEDLAGQELSTDHLRGRVCVQTGDREGGRDTQDDEMVCLSDGTEFHRGAENRGVGLKVTGCTRAQWWNAAFTEREPEWKWETQMGRKRGEESDKEKEGKLSVSPALPPCLCGCAGSAVLWWREITKAQPEDACTDTVITSALLTMALLHEYKPKAVWAPPCNSCWVLI